MSERVYFFELAKRFGVGNGGPPPMPEPSEQSASAPKPAGPMTHPNVWSREQGKQLLDYLKEQYPAGSDFEYDGHADCWLMLAVMDQLRDRNISTYIGVFDRSLPITPYRIGGQPTEGQPCVFSVEERGDDVLLTVHLDPEKGPFDMPFAQIVAPDIPDGKNLYVRLDGRHLLFTFPVALTYGEKCRSIIMDYSGDCICAVSHRPDLAVGSRTENPFAGS